MSTASDVTNAERWLADAQAALQGGLAKVAKLQEHAAAAEAEIPRLRAAVDTAEDQLVNVQDQLNSTSAYAGVAEAEGGAN